jgi:hypothetical protein
MKANRSLLPSSQLLLGGGLMLHRFHDMSRRTCKPLMLNNNPNLALSQVLWCDAVYVLDLTRFDRLEPEALVKLG